MKYFISILIAWLVGSACVAETTFRPGQIWKDDNGVHINAHGGGVLYHEGAYYWYGEHKGGGRGGSLAKKGVHVYGSKDLVNWQDGGIALEVSDDKDSDIYKGCVMERPKVIYNSRTRKFVMWFHLELPGCGYQSARSGVAVSDSPAGPFKFLYSARPNARQWPVNAPEEVTRSSVMDDFEEEHKGCMGQEFGRGRKEKEAYRNLQAYWSKGGLKHEIYRRDFECGQFARDMTLFVDEDGTAYHIFASEENKTLHISELTWDYTKHTGKWARVRVGENNEAPAMFKHEGKYYLLASGCTGWDPNAARSYVADDIFGPYESLGNPCRGTNPQTGMGPDKTFGGQSNFILKVQNKKDTFIAMFDEWRPKNHVDGRYYWLPITLTDEGFIIEWQDEWEL